MRKATILAAVAALALGSAAFAKPPDGYSTTSAAYARRGALGANDYVATNVAPCKSAYQIVRVNDGRLRDRAVNVVSVTNDVTLALPGRRTVAGYARALCVNLSVGAPTARVTLTGAAALWGTPGTDGLDLAEGRHFVSVVEIDDNVYLLDVQGVERISEEGGE